MDAAAKVIGSITNRGERNLGSQIVCHTVAGDSIDPDATTTKVPKRLQANIQGGALCASVTEKPVCAPLPISGVGLFDSVYLGDRLRIGQNVNGDGALVVQVRMDGSTVVVY